MYTLFLYSILKLLIIQEENAAGKAGDCTNLKAIPYSPRLSLIPFRMIWRAFAAASFERGAVCSRG
jgi:hypothetical protein